MASPYDGAADVVTDAPMERLEVRTFHHSPLAQPPVISSLQAFGATVVVAAILSYLLIFCKPRSGKGQGGSAGSDRGAAEPEEYFRAILGEAKLDSWHGKEQGCQWTQTDEEVEVTTPMPSGAKGRDVSCKVLTASLKIAIQGAVVLEGKLFRRVQHEECDWSVEERDGERVLRLTLVKAVPTKGAQHWTSLLEKKPPSGSAGAAPAGAASRDQPGMQPPPEI